MPLTIEEKKEKIVRFIDPDFLIEILDVKTEYLVELLEDEIEDQWSKFEYLEDDNEEEQEEAAEDLDKTRPPW